LKSICHNHFLLFQINALHGVLDYDFYFIFADNTYNLGVFVSVWQTAIFLSVGLSEKRES